ncbi:hypothetical protein ACKI1I_37055 [Streptomyces turgidiscabies]|uniref:Uncharacterized protein n=1 Tax=Streptomyces turgidiscabies (strain Car8) TaxID=698760 RepID=L7FHI9_STRT8|nr:MULTISPECIES: hypothetical protein [Streptomyces]ELP70531.1 hypothetical protein STRTUCAR8_09881 [Streptomyces turgidiscabies Car8]MDX3496472.1 hypothetical protein [Streptomyces turgidiscabies]GAQ76732.1 hypothetical protein T45_08535 [Streptomyces turgidiscabies]
MQREDLPDNATSSGLSTDDLAHPRDTYTGDGTADTSAEVPTFPGESTSTPSDRAEDEPEGAGGSGTQDDMMEPDSGAPRHQAEDRGDRAEDEAPQLLTPEDEEGFRTRWQEVQNEFVDDPRDAVHTADALVAEVMQKLAATFADHKQELEGQWNRGEQANTEDLRLALRHYRSFFNRLLVT